jgi:hypothetical protein
MGLSRSDGGILGLLRSKVDVPELHNKLTKRRSIYAVANLSNHVALEMPTAVVRGFYIILKDLRAATSAFHRKTGQVVLAAIVLSFVLIMRVRRGQEG